MSIKEELAEWFKVPETEENISERELEDKNDFSV
jgi:hypothetical protein